MNAAAVRTIVNEEIVKAMQTGGAVDIVVAPMSADLKTRTAEIKELQDRTAKLEKMEADMNKHAPFLEYERKCAPDQLVFAWRKLLVDQDVMANLADNMGDVSVANVMVACANNPADAELKKQKKHANRTSAYRSRACT